MEIYGFTLSAADLWLLGICGALIMALIGYRLALNVQKHNAFNAAALTFRTRILTELEGLYPVPHFWDQSEFTRFRQSIPKIQSAAAEFMFYLAHKGKFDNAVKEYNNYCNEITWDKCVQWDMYPSMRTPGDKGPIEKFKHIIEELLSYAKEK
jgi:hypothetical protein